MTAQHLKGEKGTMKDENKNEAAGCGTDGALRMMNSIGQVDCMTALN